MELDEVFPDLAFDDLFAPSVRTIKFDKHARVVFPDMVTAVEKDLLFLTAINLGYMEGKPGTCYLFCKEKTLSDDSELAMLKTMGFDFLSKFFVLRNLIKRYDICLATWQSFLPLFVNREGVTIRDLPKKTHKFSGTHAKFSIHTTKQLADLAHTNLLKHGLVKGRKRGGSLSSAAYPGSVAVQQTRMKTFLKIPEKEQLAFIKRQVWGDDSPYAIFETMENMLCTIECVLSEPPPKKIKLEITPCRQSPETEPGPVEVAPRPRTESTESEPEVVVVPHDVPEPVPPGNTGGTDGTVGSKFVGRKVVAQYKESWKDRQQPLNDFKLRWRRAIIFIAVVMLLRFGFFDNLPRYSSTGDWGVWTIMTCLTSFCVFRLTHNMGSNFDWVVCGFLELVLYFWDEIGIAIPHGIFLIFAVCMQLPQRFIWQTMFVAYLAFIVCNFWFTVFPVWAPFVQIPLTCLSLWNQHRQKIKNPASILIAPYRDTLCIIFLIIGTATCANCY